MKYILLLVPFSLFGMNEGNQSLPQLSKLESLKQ